MRIITRCRRVLGWMPRLGVAGVQVDLAAAWRGESHPDLISPGHAWEIEQFWKTCNGS